MKLLYSISQRVKDRGMGFPKGKRKTNKNAGLVTVNVI